LDASLRFRERRFEYGWPDAAPLIEAERARCVGWMLLAWVRWMEAVGPAAAAVDLEAIDALLHRGWELYLDGHDTGELDWAAALLAAIRTDGAADLEVARSMFEERANRATHDDELRVLRVDQLRYTSASAGPPLNEPSTPEGRLAQERLDRALR